MSIFDLRGHRALPIITVASFIFAVTAWFMADSEKKEPRPALPLVAGPVTGAPIPQDVKKAELPILRVEPDVNQEGVSSAPKIVVYFRNSAKGKTVNIKVTPAFDFKASFDNAATVLTVTPNTPLKAKTKYSIEILQNGTVLYGWSFTTGDDVVSVGDVAAINKLKATLPYRSDHFWIEYKSIADVFNVYIDAKPVETYKQAALNYFKSQGISDPSKLNIAIIPVGEAATP